MLIRIGNTVYRYHQQSVAQSLAHGYGGDGTVLESKQHLIAVLEKAADQAQQPHVNCVRDQFDGLRGGELIHPNTPKHREISKTVEIGQCCHMLRNVDIIAIGNNDTLHLVADIYPLGEHVDLVNAVFDGEYPNAAFVIRSINVQVGMTTVVSTLIAIDLALDTATWN